MKLHNQITPFLCGFAAPPKVSLERAENPQYAQARLQAAPSSDALFPKELPSENGCHTGRLLGFFLFKDIHFMPEGLKLLSVFDKDFFQIEFVIVVFPGSHQFISCLVLISGRNFKDVHDGKKWH